MEKQHVRPIRHPDRILNYWKREPFTVVCIVVFGLAFNGAMVLSPIYQGKLIDSILGGGTFSTVVRAAGLFVSLVAAIQIMRNFKRFYVRRFANVTVATMRRMIYNAILAKSTPELETENMGNLMTRAVSDVDLCVEGMRKFTTEVFDTGVLMLAYAITLFVYDVQIALLSVLFIPVAMILAEQLKTIIYKYTSEFRKKSGEVAMATYDAVDHSMLYRISGMETENGKRYDALLSDLETTAIKANVLENSMQPVYNVIAMAGIVSVIYLAGMKVIDGVWTIGVFSTLVTMFIALAVKASKAAKLFNSVQKSQISWQRIKPYLQEYAVKDRTLHIRSGKTDLSVEHLGLAYSTQKENFLPDLVFQAHQGEIIGVTGPVAVGKSTLGLALTGLYPYLGSIKIDGKELKDYSECEKSAMISYLGHHPELFSAPIEENIALGNAGEVSAVLDDVCFAEDLATMPEGIRTLVGNAGIRLSGGQQARIALARALFSHPKILVLDDPFSAVDMKTEETILANLKTHYRDSLIFLISHRLALFDRLDRILLLKADSTYELGTHAELMKKSDLYAAIYALQSAERGVHHEE